MTSLKTTWLASLTLGFAFGGTALAQPPAQPQPTDDTPTNQDDTGADVNAGVNAGVDGDDVNADASVNADANVDTDADVNAPTPDSDIDVNVNNPPPPPPTYTTPPASYTTVIVPDSDRGAYGEEYAPRYGIAIAAGGGASGFTSESLRGTTNFGGDWDVRLTFGTRSPLAFEASYIGSAQSIDALGLDSDAMLVGNGVQGALRLNTTIDLPVQPFIYGGVAWRRYDLTNTSANTSDISDSDDVLEVPVGVGIAGKFQGLIVDARGEFRPAWFQDLVPDVINDTGLSDGYGSMHRWGVNASVGYEF